MQHRCIERDSCPDAAASVVHSRPLAGEFFSSLLETRPKRGVSPASPEAGRPSPGWHPMLAPSRSSWLATGLPGRRSASRPSLPGRRRLVGGPRDAQVGHSGVPHPLDLRFGAAEAARNACAEVLEAADGVLGFDSQA